MKKAIILSNGVVKEMTFEQVLDQFKPMMNKWAYSALNKIVYSSSKPDKEELLQEMRIQAWTAFQRYDEIHAFSTILVPRLQHAIHVSTNKMYAQKRTRKGHQFELTMDEVMSGDNGEGGGSLAGLLGEEDEGLVSLEFREFIEGLEKRLDDVEKKMVRVLIEKEDGYSVQDFANEEGISRQGANKKLNKFKEKMEMILLSTGYAVC